MLRKMNTKGTIIDIVFVLNKTNIIKNVRNIMKIHFHLNAILDDVGTKKKKKKKKKNVTLTKKK